MKSRHQLKRTESLLISPWRRLSIVSSLILAGCVSAEPKGQPTATNLSPQGPAAIPSAPKQTQLSSPSASPLAAGLSPPTMPGQAKSEEAEAATRMEAVQVNESKLVGYHFFVMMGVQETVWLEHSTPRFPDVCFWTEPGYDRYQMVAIEDRNFTQLSAQQLMHLARTLPEPMHITLRSSSGRIVQAEAFYSSDPQREVKQSSSRMAPPTK